MSVIDSAIESVMDLIDSLNNFATIRRGALGTNPGLACEIAPSSVDSVFLDKNSVIDIDLAINGKHNNLQTLTNTLNQMCDYLTRLKTYPSGNGWQIIDITRGSPSVPTVIGREENSDWLMAVDVIIKTFRKDENV